MLTVIEVQNVIKLKVGNYHIASAAQLECGYYAVLTPTEDIAARLSSGIGAISQSYCPDELTYQSSFTEGYAICYTDGVYYTTTEANIRRLQKMLKECAKDKKWLRDFTQSLN